MFFLTKSALCIGVVAALAMGAAGGGTLRDAAESGRTAAASLGRTCAASAGCLGLGTRIVAAALDEPGAVPASLAEAASKAITAPSPQVDGPPAAPAAHPRRDVRHGVVARN